MRQGPWTGFGKISDSFFHAGDDLSGAWRERRLTCDRISEVDGDRSPSCEGLARQGIQRESHTLAQRGRKRRIGAAIRDVDQGNYLEAGLGRATQRLDLLGRRAFLHESELEPLLDFTIAFAQIFGEFTSSFALRRTQHRRSETEALSERTLAKQARRWRKQETDGDRHACRDPDKEPRIKKPACGGLAPRNASEQIESVSCDEGHGRAHGAELARRGQKKGAPAKAPPCWLRAKKGNL